MTSGYYLRSRLRHPALLLQSSQGTIQSADLKVEFSIGKVGHPNDQRIPVLGTAQQGGEQEESWLSHLLSHGPMILPGP
jgi:hypothetical protein